MATAYSKLADNLFNTHAASYVANKPGFEPQADKFKAIYAALGNKGRWLERLKTADDIAIKKIKSKEFSSQDIEYVDSLLHQAGQTYFNKYGMKRLNKGKELTTYQHKVVNFAKGIEHLVENYESKTNVSPSADVAEPKQRRSNYSRQPQEKKAGRGQSYERPVKAPYQSQTNDGHSLERVAQNARGKPSSGILNRFYRSRIGRSVAGLAVGLFSLASSYGSISPAQVNFSPYTGSEPKPGHVEVQTQNESLRKQVIDLEKRLQQKSDEQATLDQGFANLEGINAGLKKEVGAYKKNALELQDRLGKYGETIGELVIGSNDEIERLNDQIGDIQEKLKGQRSLTNLLDSLYEESHKRISGLVNVVNWVIGQRVGEYEGQGPIDEGKSDVSIEKETGVGIGKKGYRINQVKFNQLSVDNEKLIQSFNDKKIAYDNLPLEAKEWVALIKKSVNFDGKQLAVSYISHPKFKNEGLYVQDPKSGLFVPFKFGQEVVYKSGTKQYGDYKNHRILPDAILGHPENDYLRAIASTGSLQKQVKVKKPEVVSKKQTVVGPIEVSITAKAPAEPKPTEEERPLPVDWSKFLDLNFYRLGVQ